MYLRKSNERGHENFGWLQSRHSFSFGYYYDPEHLGVSTLKVINDDIVTGGAGFEEHGHRDMEIISYVLEGSLEHKDTLGNQFVVSEGEVQRMSAGTGIRHSEFNHSKTDQLRFLQIWISPDQKGLAPSYEQNFIAQGGKLTALVTPDGREESLKIHQQTSIQRLVLKPGESWNLQESESLIDVPHKLYIHILEGHADFEDKTQSVKLEAGDGLGIENQDANVINNSDQVCSALVFYLPTSES